MTGAVHIDAVDDPDGALEAVVEALLAGGLVVLPTDTVYGLAALPDDEGATGALFDLKGRSRATPLAVLCTDLRQAVGLVPPEDAEKLLAVGERWWPGPLTLVCRRRAGLHLHLGEPFTTVGLRVPDHPMVRAVAERVGPIAVTSANRHGEPSAVTAEEALTELGAGVAVVADEGPLEGRASTVIDTTSIPWHVLREGPLRAADVIAATDVPFL